MKKLISILLAMLMMFSLVTVAFAAEDAAPENGTEAVGGENDGGEAEEAPSIEGYEWLLDLPFWTVGPALKFAKIALKLVNVFLKVAKIFGFVEKDMGDYIIDLIEEMIKDAQNGEQTEEPTTAPEGTTAPAAAA